MHTNSTNNGTPRTRWRPLGAALTAIATAVVLAACGSADDGGTATAGSSTASAGSSAAAGTASTAAKCGLATGKKATGTPIAVGAVVTASGGIDFSSATNGARAYFDCVNDNGGINGRPVRYSAEDDALNPQRARVAAAKVVDDEKAVALVGSSSQIDCAVNGEFYTQRKILAIYGTGVPQQCFQTPNIAPVNAGPRLGAIATAQYAVKHGAKKLALIVPKVPGVGDWVAAGVQAWASAHGVQLVKSVLSPPGLKDGTSVVLELASASPDAIIDALPGTDNPAFFKAAQQQALKGRMKFYCLTPCYDTAFPKSVGSYWNGLEVNAEFQLLDAKTPDNLLWQDVMKKYAAGKRADSFSQGGMLAAKIFTDTMLKIKDPATIDRAVATKALRAIKDYKSDLICGKFTFGGGAGHASNRADRMVRVDGDGFAQAEGCTAIDDPELSAG